MSRRSRRRIRRLGAWLHDRGLRSLALVLYEMAAEDARIELGR